MKFQNLILIVISFIVLGCQSEKANEPKPLKASTEGVELVVLGTVQDGGAPHIGCKKACCERLWKNPDESLKVVSLGVIDHDNDKVYIFEATPDFPEQIAHLNRLAGRKMDQMPDGIFITHAHIGHYTGLMFLGREAKGAKEVPVYVMPQMQYFLNSNGPWDQLVNLENIALKSLSDTAALDLPGGIEVTPFRVPHRDEYSETVGFIIAGQKKKTMFIPDIDKWSKWEEDIVGKMSEVDVAFLDATFYDGEEINNRDIAEIPHPFVIESMALFDNLPANEKAKVRFIHLNHTNPLLDEESEAYKKVVSKGYKVANFGNRSSI